MKELEIGGHTDNIGSDEKNLIAFAGRVNLLYHI
jgi:hypothetical protein